jgi:hypothetical protein
VRKTILLFAVILCLCFGGVSFANGGSATAERFYPETVYQVRHDGKIDAITDPEGIKNLFEGVKSNNCGLNILGPKEALPAKVPSAKNNFTLEKKPDPRVVFIIYCKGDKDPYCYPTPTGWKCCPPCCPPACR